MRAVIGGAFLLMAGALCCRTFLRAGKLRRRALFELAALLELAEQEIAGALFPLPRFLCGGGTGRTADAFRTEIESALRSGAPLPEAWRRATETLPLRAEQKSLLFALAERFSGEEESVCAALHMTAVQLRGELAKEEASRASQERLVTATVLSAAVFIWIILM